MTPTAGAPGLNLVDVFSGELLFLGVAVFAAIAALAHEHERPYSASIVYLLLGVVAAAGLHLLDVSWLTVEGDAAFIDNVTEIALIVALFASGLRVTRPITWHGWRWALLLIAVAMPLSIALVAAFGMLAMGLELGAALLLGAILAPTDPVLAGAVGIGPPGEEPEESDARFNLTAEASLNDAMVSPFVFLSFLIIQHGGTAWTLEWLLADVLYATALGLALGAAAGWALGWLTSRMFERELMSRELATFLAIGAVLVVHGLVELLDGYGFLAVFVAGLAFHRHELEHESHRQIHDGTQVSENFLELAVILVLGSLVTLSAFEEPGLAGWLLVPLIILAIRPATALAVLAPSHLPWRERAFVAWFGVKGVASVHFAALALNEDVISGGLAQTIFWTVALVVMASIIVHGALADTITRRLLEH